MQDYIKAFSSYLFIYLFIFKDIQHKKDLDSPKVTLLFYQSKEFAKCKFGNCKNI